MNVNASLKWLIDLYKQGVRDLCICPGGRNAPIIKALTFLPEIKTFYFFDERSAGFFALGLAKKNNRPIGVVTTSGTAVANLLPATIEAYYTGWPLVLITADRPKRFRQTAAPQSIEQVGIFSNYVARTFDLEVQSELEVFEIDSVRPTHINLCFDEPLLLDFDFVENLYIKSGRNSFIKNLNSTTKQREYLNLWKGLELAISKDFNSFLEIAKSPLVILGPIEGTVGDESRRATLEATKRWKLPIYAEATSGLRECKDLNDLIIENSESAFKNKDYLSNFDSVIRVGQVPTNRIWRDLELKFKDWPVLNFTQLPFSGISRDRVWTVPISKLPEFELKNDIKNDIKPPFELNNNSEEANQSKVELEWVKFLSQNLPIGSNIFLGNSLPIREWDQVASFKDRNYRYYCNRGANGIDGLVSTAMGLTEVGRPTFAIIGDLSALYDLNALHAIKYVEELFYMIVINNRGGKIFTPMFNDERFENSHSHSFENIAKMFKINYLSLTKTSEWKLPSVSTLIELQV